MKHETGRNQKQSNGSKFAVGILDFHGCLIALFDRLGLGLISSSSGRIINASSLMHRRVQHLDLDNFDFHKGVGPFMDVYSISKLCIILWTRLLALRLKDTAVTVNCYHPGVVDTDMMVAPQAWINVLLWIPRRFFFKVTRPSVESTPGPSSDLVPWFCFQTPFEGAQTALYLATSDQGGSVSGEYFADCKASTSAVEYFSTRNSWLDSWLQVVQ